MKIAVFDLCVYLVYFSLFKAYFIPDAIRQVVKIISLIIVLIFLIKRLQKNGLFNCSLLFSSAIVISGLYNYIFNNYTIKALLDSFSYALSFYDLYSLFLYANRSKRTEKMSCDLYRVTFVYCMLTAISVLIVGTENNSNVSAYLFGNKFTSSYLFIALIALYGLSHNMNIRKNKAIICFLTVIAFVFTLYVECATATVALVVSIFLFWIEQKKQGNSIQNPVVTVCVLVGTAVVPFTINAVLQNSMVRYVIFDLFNRTTTVYGRFEIYNNYLQPLLLNRFWLGYGYSNGVMLTVTGVFGNAQNGLLEQMMNFGFIGVVAILVTVFYALRQKRNLSYMAILLYAMIVAAIFEVTINWFFWMALFSVQYLNNETKTRRKNEDNWDLINARS